MFEIEIKINGKIMTSGNVQTVLEAAAIEAIEKDYRKQVGRLVCETHNQAAKLTLSGKKLSSLKAVISGCCDDFVKQVEEKLR